tara:strand:+ start:571 stop:1419 length:849 start_codon:yes stop_codon:yes gene_type:complete
MIKTPKVYNWVGGDSSTLYWDEPSNWAEGEYPNQKEAIAVFANSAQRDTTILLRKDIHLAQMWFSEKHSLTFSSESDGNTLDGLSPKILLETSNQFSTLFVDKDNLADHRFGAWILHSCCFLVAHRDRNGLPDADLNRPADETINTIHFEGGIGNYKDPERASLQVFGYQKAQLNGINRFKGPVVIANGGEVKVMVNNAIPDGTPITLNNGGAIFAEEGVYIKASELIVDGKIQEPGIYHGKNFDVEAIEKLKKTKLFRSKKVNTMAISNIKGNGAIFVDVQ